MANDALSLVVEELATVFDRRGVQYALIGGLAVGVRSQIRTTKDADFIVHSPALSFPALLEDLVSLGFQIDVLETIRRWPVEKFTVFYRGSERVDWMQPILPIYNHVMTGAESRDWGRGTKVRVATAEGLILTKLIAFRPRDQLDIENLISANCTTLNVEYIREEWSVLASGEPDRTAWLETMIAKYVPSGT